MNLPEISDFTIQFTGSLVTAFVDK
jgi:hypothetical protein